MTMKTRALAIIAVLAACPPPSQSGTDGALTTSTTSTASTTAATTSTTAAPTTTAADTSTSTTTGIPCPVGAFGCECTPGGFCDPPLVCEAGTCVEGCAVGSLGCACTGGGGCDAGLTCDAGTCVDGISPTCIADQVMDDCCGDGWLDEFEECDLGKNYNGDNAPCTLKCKHAVCGDGVVLENMEACDGGDLCTPACTFKSCGNGIVEPHEWCEPRGDGDPECTALCGDARKVVFLSSTHYKGGDIGGLVGADAKCQTHAESVSLAGTFKAWLGVSEETQPSSWAWPNVPHVTVSGDLVVGLCDATIIVDEFGAPHPGCAVPVKGSLMWAWFMDKWSDSFETCSEWTNSIGDGVAVTIDSCSLLVDVPCSEAAPIVCVEQ